MFNTVEESMAAESAEDGPVCRGNIPIRERFAVNVPLAAQCIGICQARVYELLKDGTLEGRIIRGRRVVLVESLMRMVGEAPTTRRAAPNASGALWQHRRELRKDTGAKS